MSERHFPRGNEGSPGEKRPAQEPLATANWFLPQAVCTHLCFDENDPTNTSPFLLGHLPDEAGKNTLLAYNDDSHIVTIAGSRSGKGVSLVVPNLLSYRGSVICVDLKGENAAITAQYRRDVLGQDMMILDPFHVTEFETAQFNPLAFLEPDSHTLIDDVGDISEALIVRTSGKDAHWDESAKSVIKMILLYIVLEHPKEERHLVWLRDYLLTGIQSEESGSSSFNNFLLLLDDHTHSFISGMAKRLLDMGDNERGSVMSTVFRNTEFLDSPSIQETIKCSDIDLSSLRGLKGASIYLVMPEIRLAGQTRWLRLLITVFLQYLQTDIKTDPHAPSVMLVLDEFAALGYMQVIERATGYIAGFGVKIWSILQDLSQLKDIYPRRWETFLGNAGILTAFGNIDLTTQDYLSKRIGQCEINRIEYNYSGNTSENKNTAPFTQIIENPEILLGQGGSKGSSDGWTANPKQMISPLLLADEIGRKFGRHSENILILIGGSQPIWAHRLFYYKDEPFKSRAGQNPYYQG